MAFKKKTGGRKPGVPNRVPAALKEMILQALELEGGVEYIRKQAREEPVSFMTMLGKVLPLSLANEDPKGLVIQVVKYGEDQS